MADSKNFPTWVYGPEGKSRMVMSQEEFDQLEGEWHDSPAKVSDAQSGRDTQASDGQAGTAAYIEKPRQALETLESGHTHRDRLEAQARSLGVKFTKNTTNEELQDKIFKAGSD